MDKRIQDSQDQAAEQNPAENGQDTYDQAAEKQTGKGSGKRSQRLRNIPLLIAIGVMYVVVTTTDEVERKEINQEQIIINEEVKETQKEEVEKKVSKGYRNIALFGVDARDGELGRGTRSDTIIIASINQDTQEIKLVSVFRDTYLNLGNDSYNKCNAAYAQGGPEQAINMLNTNLDLDITDYVTVGFGGLIDSVDALGGI